MLGKKIRELRKEKGLTQKELSERIGVSESTVKKWEQDQVEPNANAIMSLIVFFNVTADYLFGRSSKYDLIEQDKDLQRVIEVVKDLPEAHREALFRYAELLKRGNDNV